MLLLLKEKSMNTLIKSPKSKAEASSCRPNQNDLAIKFILGGWQS